MSKKWYVVHAYSGFEKNVARALGERVGLSELGDFFGEIMVPTEEVVEMRAGQKRRSERKFFPGYVLVEMELNTVFEPGEIVRVVDGPFNDFSGVVEEVNYEKNRLNVAVTIFGRSTPVELDFGQVEKG